MSNILDTKVSLIGNIFDLMQSDNENQSETLYRVWKQATAEQLNALDAAFIALCGYSLSTIIREQGENNVTGAA